MLMLLYVRVDVVVDVYVAVGGVFVYVVVAVDGDVVAVGHAVVVVGDDGPDDAVVGVAVDV